MSNTKKYLGARIQEIRKSKNIKQAEFAEMIDVDPKHMSKIECGRCFPSFELLDRIAEKLDIPVAKFLEVEHLEDRNILIEKIVEKLNNTPTEKLKTVYKVMVEVL